MHCGLAYFIRDPEIVESIRLNNILTAIILDFSNFYTRKHRSPMRYSSFIGLLRIQHESKGNVLPIMCESFVQEEVQSCRPIDRSVYWLTEFDLDRLISYPSQLSI